MELSRYRRKMLLGAGMLITALAFVYTCYTEYQAAARTLEVKRAELTEAQRLVDEIIQARAQPPVASLEFESPEQLTQRVAQSVYAAGLGERALLSLSPLQPTRLGNSPYQQRLTELELRAVTLPMLIGFANQMRDEASGLFVRDLTLVPTAENYASNGLERWDVQVILTQMIYSPTSR